MRTAIAAAALMPRGAPLRDDGAGQPAPRPQRAAGAFAATGATAGAAPSEAAAPAGLLAPARTRRFPPVPVIGNLPPPVTGQAAITEAAAQALEGVRPVRRASLSPGAARGPLRHPVRLLRTALAAAALVCARLRGDGRPISPATAAGGGSISSR